MKFVLLTDDDGCALVACKDQTEAEEVGRAAIYSGGGVSAWLLPDRVLTDAAMVQRTLRADGTVNAVFHSAGKRVGINVTIEESA